MDYSAPVRPVGRARSAYKIANTFNPSYLMQFLSVFAQINCDSLEPIIIYNFRHTNLQFYGGVGALRAPEAPWHLYRSGREILPDYGFFPRLGHPMISTAYLILDQGCQPHLTNSVRRWLLNRTVDFVTASPVQDSLGSLH